MEHIPYAGWPHCFRLGNDLIDVIATADVGPRIVRVGFRGERNLFKEFADQMGQVGGDDWRVFGGHRLWHAPEAIPRSYQPDNTPLNVIETERGARFVQPMERATGIQKEIEVAVNPTRAALLVTHRLTNHTLWPVELAPWALSVMAPGAVGIIPLPPRGSHEEHLLPASTLALWAYTDLSDPRYTFCRTALLVTQDPAHRTDQKIGASAAPWIACWLEGFLFAKRITLQAVPYPDHNCTAEIFVNGEVLEVETLGPLARLEPGGVIEHVEEWLLFRDVPRPASDADLQAHIYPLLAGD